MHKILTNQWAILHMAQTHFDAEVEEEREEG